MLHTACTIPAAAHVHAHIPRVHSFLIQSLISSACHSLCRVTRGFNILCQIMVTFLSYISNACHSLSGVAERLQHTVTALVRNGLPERATSGLRVPTAIRLPTSCIPYDENVYFVKSADWTNKPLAYISDANAFS